MSDMKTNIIASILASQFQEELDTACRLCPNVDPILIDLRPNFDELEKIIKDCDLVIRLVNKEFIHSVPSKPSNVEELL